MIAEMRSEVEQGRRMTLEQYLRILGRSMDDLRTEMRGAAEARVRSNLVLDEIGRQDAIHPPAQEVERELLGMASLPTLKNRDKRRLMTSVEVRERVASRLRRRYVILHLLQIAMPRPDEGFLEPGLVQEQPQGLLPGTEQDQSVGQLAASAPESAMIRSNDIQSSSAQALVPGSDAGPSAEDVEMPSEPAGPASAASALETEARQEPVTGEES